MKRIGTAKLWLASGPVPHYREMVELGREIVRALVEVHGPEETVRRFADPTWLTALACVLGFEWDTSGQTTITMRALKEGLEGTDVPMRVVGGKGEEMRWAAYELERVGRSFSIKDRGELANVSRLTCSVDDSALQDSYSVYFHAMVLSEEGSWTVVNQGMNVRERLARRYHWSSDRGAVVERPHSSIFAEREEEVVLDMTSVDSRGTRETIVELLKDTPASRLNEDLAQAKALLRGQRLLDREGPEVGGTELPDHLLPPKSLDEETIRRTRGVDSFEELLTVKGMGPSTIRGLAYIASLIYGTRVSWRDPVKFAYAHGTKSGRPYMVDRRAMLRNAELLREAVLSAKLGNRERIEALKRLNSITG
ncbi:MAG: DUF763 domain-containing protein [Thaumarchaeota archaeon]|nr:DUF763 domain-containing protein [Candidatus Calditenuaceae archaeon]MDW8186866.1 DUF763 domain-containing protein [Nitrososphaerota archaeon]